MKRWKRFTVFTYVNPNSEEAERVRQHFLLVEYDPGSNNREVTEHDIDIEGFSTIRINKLKTDDYMSVYQSLSALQLPVSAMDIRKVQNVVKDIYAGESINFSITDDIDGLKNYDKMLVMGSKKPFNIHIKQRLRLLKSIFRL